MLNKVVMTLFFAAIILYMGGAAWRGLRDPYPTVQAYTYVVEDTMEATGYLVRQEQVIHGWTIQAEGTEATVRLLPSEGEKIAAGTTVALLYSDGAAMERSQRLETLEGIGASFPGVEKCFAIQAGREIRIMVEPDKVSEDQMVLLAREVAKKIEDEMEYPGQIKVNIIRETKAVDYAK